MTTNVSTRFLDHRRRSLAQRQQRRRTILLAGFAAAATMAGGWWVATGPIMRVHHVSISGYTHSDQADVVRAVQIGAATGDALHLPVQRIRQAVADMPWVEGVTVRHDWPRGVSVTIRQARPAVVAVVGGERWLVSSSGRVLGPEGTVERDLPEIGLVDAKRGEWLRGDAAAAVTLATALSPDVRGMVRDLRVDGTGLMTGRIAGGAELRFGPPVDLWRKGRALDAVLADAQTRRLALESRYVDFSTADAPVFGTADPGSADSTETGGSGESEGEVSTSG